MRTSARAAAAVATAALAAYAGCGTPAAVRASLHARDSGPALLSFRMTTATAGWAFTAKRVLRTVDGGRSWNDRTPTGLNDTTAELGPGGGPPANVAIIGVASAWLAAASPGAVRIFRTSDAGAHWHTATVTPAAITGLPRTDVPIVLGLDAVDARTGLLLTSNGGAGAGSEDVELYRTRDSGITWTLIAAATQQHPSPGGFPAGGIKTGLGFVSVKRGWLTGYRGSQSGAWLYATDDGGRTWRAATLPTPRRYPTSGQLTFPPDFTGRAGVLPTLWPAQRATIFYTTRDGGLHWHPTAPVPSSGGNALRAWSWPNQTHGFAAPSGTLCATTNGGHSWKCRPAPRVLQHIVELQFPTPRLGWALSGTQLFRTADGGITWTPTKG